MAMNNKVLIYLGIIILVVLGYTMIKRDNFISAGNLLIYNGSIITMEPETPSVEAVYVENGIIQAVGDYDKISKSIHPDTKKIDLDGKTLLPGFIDSHTHPVVSAFMHGTVDLSGFKHRSKEELWSLTINQVNGFSAVD